MSDTKHTKGPWHEGSHRAIESQSGTICEVYSHMGIEEADANQKLIAAAPDLLDALHLALPFVEDHAGDPCYKAGAVDKAVKTIKAAIAKATGGAA